MSIFTASPRGIKGGKCKTDFAGHSTLTLHMCQQSEEKTVAVIVLLYFLLTVNKT